MPIAGLTDRPPQLPIIGKLRKGGVKPEGRPGADLKHFRFDSLDAKATADFEAVYGKQPVAIRVLLPYPTLTENFDTWMEEYTASSLVRRCDKCNIQRQLINGKYSNTPAPCIAPKCACKQVGRLSVVIPELKRFVIVTAETHSINDIVNLDRQLSAFQLLLGNLGGIPFILSRRPVMISTPDKDGKRARREKWLLHIEVDPAYSALKLNAMQQAALPAPVQGETLVDERDDEDDENQIIERAATQTTNGNGKHVETASKTWHDLVTEAAQTAKALIANADATNGAALSAAVSDARGLFVISKIAAPSESEIAATLKQLNDAISAATPPA